MNGRLPIYLLDTLIYTITPIMHVKYVMQFIIGINVSGYLVIFWCTLSKAKPFFVLMVEPKSEKGLFKENEQLRNV